MYPFGHPQDFMPSEQYSHQQSSASNTATVGQNSRISPNILRTASRQNICSGHGDLYEARQNINTDNQSQAQPTPLILYRNPTGFVPNQGSRFQMSDAPTGYSVFKLQPTNATVEVQTAAPASTVQSTFHNVSTGYQTSIPGTALNHIMQNDPNNEGHATSAANMYSQPATQCQSVINAEILQPPVQDKTLPRNLEFSNSQQSPFVLNTGHSSSLSTGHEFSPSQKNQPVVNTSHTPSITWFTSLPEVSNSQKGQPIVSTGNLLPVIKSGALYREHDFTHSQKSMSVVNSEYLPLVISSKSPDAMMHVQSSVLYTPEVASTTTPLRLSQFSDDLNQPEDQSDEQQPSSSAQQFVSAPETVVNILQPEKVNIKRISTPDSRISDACSDELSHSIVSDEHNPVANSLTRQHTENKQLSALLMDSRPTVSSFLRLAPHDTSISPSSKAQSTKSKRLSATQIVSSAVSTLDIESDVNTDPDVTMCHVPAKEAYSNVLLNRQKMAKIWKITMEELMQPSTIKAAMQSAERTCTQQPLIAPSTADKPLSHKGIQRSSHGVICCENIKEEMEAVRQMRKTTKRSSPETSVRHVPVKEGEDSSEPIAHSNSPTRLCTDQNSRDKAMSHGLVHTSVMDKHMGICLKMQIRKVACAISSNYVFLTAEGTVFAPTGEPLTYSYWCNYCSFKTQKEDVLIQHVLEHRFKCQVCDFEAFSRTEVLDHSLLVHVDFADQASILKYCCLSMDYSKIKKSDNKSNAAQKRKANDSNYSQESAKCKMVKTTSVSLTGYIPEGIDRMLEQSEVSEKIVSPLKIVSKNFVETVSIDTLSPVQGKCDESAEVDTDAGITDQNTPAPRLLVINERVICPPILHQRRHNMQTTKHFVNVVNPDTLPQRQLDLQTTEHFSNVVSTAKNTAIPDSTNEANPKKGKVVAANGQGSKACVQMPLLDNSEPVTAEDNSELEMVKDNYESDIVEDNSELDTVKYSTELVSIKDNSEPYSEAKAESVTLQDYKKPSRSTEAQVTKQNMSKPSSSDLCWKCGYCEFVTHQQGVLRNHISCKHGRVSHRYIALLLDHENNEANESDSCEKPSPQITNNDANSSATEPGPKVYKCALCNFIESSSVLIKNHMWLTHPGCLFYTIDLKAIEMQKPHYIFLCHKPDCSFNTKEMDNYVKHTETCTSHLYRNKDLQGEDIQMKKSLDLTLSFARKTDKTRQYVRVVSSRLSKPGGNKYVCLYCSYSSGVNTLVKKHTISNHEKRLCVMRDEHVDKSKQLVYFCRHCLWETRTKSMLKLHLLEKHKDADEVKEKLNAKNSVTTDQKKVTEELNLKSNFCNSPKTTTATNEDRYLALFEFLAAKSQAKGRDHRVKEESDKTKVDQREFPAKKTQKSIPEKVVKKHLKPRRGSVPETKKSIQSLSTSDELKVSKSTSDTSDVNIKRGIATDAELPLYRCSWCSVMAYNAENSKRHLVITHPNVILLAIDICRKQRGDEVPFAYFCPEKVCFFTSDAASKLVEHVISAHRYVTTHPYIVTLIETLKEMQKMLRIQQNAYKFLETYECSKCTASHVTQSVLHMKNHFLAAHPKHEILFRDMIAKKQHKRARIYMCSEKLCNFLTVDMKEFQLHGLGHK